MARRDGMLTAFLHLDMDHLGALDISIALQTERNQITTKFYLDEDSIALVQDHIGELTERLSKKGYQCKHMVIEKEGIPCQCGRKGCFERYASMKVFKNNLRESLQLDETTRGEELLEMLRRNNPENKDYELIEAVVSQYIENLAIGIQNLISIFEPEAIGIGGSFVYFEDVFLDRLKKTLQDINKKDEQRKNIKVVPAVLGNDAGIIGAVL